MNKFIIVPVIFFSIIALTFSGCGGPVKSGDISPKDSVESIDPFDFGDEFSQIAVKKSDTGAGDKESVKIKNDDTNETPSITSDYLDKLQKSKGTKSPDSYLNVNILGYRVQLGAFENKENAERTAKSARSKFDLPVYVIYQAPFYRVRAGDFIEKSEAEKYVKIIKEKGFRDARWVPTRINTQ